MATLEQDWFQKARQEALGQNDEEGLQVLQDKDWFQKARQEALGAEEAPVQEEIQKTTPVEEGPSFFSKAFNYLKDVNKDTSSAMEEAHKTGLTTANLGYTPNSEEGTLGRSLLYGIAERAKEHLTKREKMPWQTQTSFDVGQGVGQGIAEAGEAVATPKNIILGALAPEVFVPSLAKGAYESGKSGLEALQKENVPEAAKQFLTSALSAAGVGGGLMHGLGRFKSGVEPKIVSEEQPITQTQAPIAPIQEQPTQVMKDLRGQIIQPEMAQGTELYSGIPITKAIEPLKQFAKQDIAPAAEKVLGTINDSIDDIKKVLAPASRSEEAKYTAGLMREGGATKAREFDRTESALGEAKKYFDQQPEQGMDFIHRIETGEKQTNPKVQEFADTMRKTLDERRDAVKALGTGKLENFYENYFPHLYEKPDQASAFLKVFGKRPLEGPKSFLKQRIYPTLKEAVDAGLKPISSNPVDYVLAKTHEMDRYIMAHNVLKSMKEEGLTKLVRSPKGIPEGWAKIDDKISTVYGPPSETGGMTIQGHYYVPESAAKVINNYLSPGLRGSAAFRGWLGMGNILNQAQLGLSAFHAGFTSVEAAIAKTALSLNKAFSGDFKGAAKAVAQAPIAPVENILRGRSVYKEWMNPGSQGPEMAKIVDALQKGGGRVRMDKFYATNATKNMLDAFRKNNIIGGLLRVTFAAIEQSARPIMEYVVPRQKLGIFMDLARHEMERNPNMTPAEMRSTMGKIWDSVDNRMGQMVYDNLFWNKTAKDLALASVRSVGWNLGTLREIGGGVKDYGAQAIKIAKGQKPEMTYRMAYIPALVMTAGTLGAITQYLMTGEGPKETKDYFFPRTGNIDENGNPERISLPTYMKDIYSYYKQPGKTLSHKAHPLIGLVSEMLQNKDYYGTEIRHEGDPLYQQGLSLLQHTGKAFTPFAVRGYQKEKELGAPLYKKMLPFIGVTPAPSYINKTDAELVAQKMIEKQMSGAPPRTSEQADKSKLKRELVRDLKKQDIAPLKEALRSGTISQKDMRTILKRSQMTPLQYHVQLLAMPDAMKVYDAATDVEKDKLKPILLKKIINSVESGDVNRIKQAKEFLQIVKPKH